jgi:hypothetical protein
MHLIPALNLWYSPRGVRRGLLVCAFAAALWMAWALAFAHGLVPDLLPGTAKQPTAPVHLELPRCGCGVVA